MCYSHTLNELLTLSLSDLGRKQSTLLVHAARGHNKAQSTEGKGLGCLHTYGPGACLRVQVSDKNIPSEQAW